VNPAGDLFFSCVAASHNAGNAFNRLLGGRDGAVVRSAEAGQCERFFDCRIFRLIACRNPVVGYVFEIGKFRAPVSQTVIFFWLSFLSHRMAGFPIGFLPRFVGVLAGAAGVAALVFFARAVATRFFPYFAAVGLLAELSLTVALLRVA
jgi:hypothetical protein